MENVPAYLGVLFGLTTGITVWLLHKAAHNSRRTLLLLLLWLLVQGIVALQGFYTLTNSWPPRLALVLGPPLLVIGLLFGTTGGRKYIDSLRLDVLTLLHVVRIPVELVLFGLYLHHAVPRLMTFEGRNWDILSGLTAPVLYYLAFRKKQLAPKYLLLWNCLALGLLLHIVGNAILSVPTPFQRFAFDQPNVAILYFPFLWLPGCVVPVVLLAHLGAIRQLLKNNREV